MFGVEIKIKSCSIHYATNPKTTNVCVCENQVKLTPARDSLQDAKLEAGNGPEGEVGAASVAAHWT